MRARVDVALISLGRLITWPVNLEHALGIARKSILGFVGQVYMLVVGLLSTVLIARLLGPEGKGVLALVAGISSLSLGAASFGLGPALAYMAGKNQYTTRSLIAAAMVWSIGLSLGVGLIIWMTRASLLSSVLKGMTSVELGIVLVSLPTYYVSAFAGALFAGHGRAVAIAALQSVGVTLNLAAVVIASLIAPRSSTAMVLALSIVSAMSAVVTLVVYRARFDFSAPTIAQITKSAVPYAMKAYLGQATSMFFLRADVFLLNYFAGPTAVGVYSVATGLAEKLWLFNTPVSNAVFSQITGATRHDSARLTTLTSRTLLLMNTAAGVGLFLLAIPVVPIVYGSEFKEAIGYLGLLLPGVVIYAVCTPYNQYFSGQLGRPGTTSALSAAMMVLSAILYFVLIPSMGAAGAAVASTLSYSSAFLGYAILMPRTANVGLRQMLVPTRTDFSLYRSIVDSVIARLTASRSSQRR